MTYKNKFIHITVFYLILLFSLISYSQTIQAELKEHQWKQHLPLQKIFNKIYLAKYGLNYPHTTKSLNRCIQYQDNTCLSSYLLVQEGKKEMSLVARQKSINAVLNSIQISCSSEDLTTANFTCHGGIMALYFFNRFTQDKTILRWVKSQPKEMRNNLFNTDFLWQKNRPNRQEWIDYISTSEINWKHETRKEILSKRFMEDIENLRGEAWPIR